MCESSLLFPDVPPAVSLASDPGGIAFQSIPTAVGGLGLLLLLLSSRRRGSGPVWQGVALALSVTAVAAQGMLAWNGFDLLRCDATEEWEGWRFVVLIGLVAVDGVLLIVGARASSVAAACLFLLLAAGTVVVDWMLRGGLVSPPSRAATRMVSVQQLFVVLCYGSLAFLPGRRGYVSPTTNQKKPPDAASGKPVLIPHIDSLAVRDRVRSGKESPPKRCTVNLFAP